MDVNIITKGKNAKKANKKIAKKCEYYEAGMCIIDDYDECIILEGLPCHRHSQIEKEVNI